MSSYFTIGHSNRPLGTFISLLHGSGITMLADVRAIPRSRYNPQFNSDLLPRSLDSENIAYRHLPALGGRRARPANGQPSPNGLWEEGGLRSYADYALTPDFDKALQELAALQAEHTLAYMCAEADWRHCHRRIITDHLLARGAAVRHIVGPGRVEDAVLHPQVVVGSYGEVTYPPATLCLGF